MNKEEMIKWHKLRLKNLLECEYPENLPIRQMRDANIFYHKTELKKLTGENYDSE